MVIILNDYSFFPRGLPFSHFWNLTLTISEDRNDHSDSDLSLLSMRNALTSLSRGFLGVSSQGLADSPGSNGGVLDIAEMGDNGNY